MTKYNESALVAEVLSYVNEYWKAFEMPIPFAFISSRWTARARRLDINLRTTVSSSDAFYTRPTIRGGLKVFPAAVVPKSDEELTEFLKDFALIE